MRYMFNFKTFIVNSKENNTWPAPICRVGLKVIFMTRGVRGLGKK